MRRIFAVASGKTEEHNDIAFEWARILDFDAGAAWTIDSAVDRPIVAFDAQWADKGDRYSRIALVGRCVVQVGTGRFPGIPTPPPISAGQSASDLDSVLAVGNAAVVAVAVSNPVRRSMSIQNVGTGTVYLSKLAGIIGSPIAGSALLGVLAPGTVNFDGRGGAVSLSGYSGPVYAICPAATSTFIAVSSY